MNLISVQLKISYNATQAESMIISMRGDRYYRNKFSLWQAFCYVEADTTE